MAPGTGFKHLAQPLGQGADGDHPAPQTCTKMAAGGAQLLALGEQADLIAHAAAAQPRHADARLHVCGKASGAK